MCVCILPLPKNGSAGNGVWDSGCLGFRSVFSYMFHYSRYSEGGMLEELHIFIRICL